MLDLDKYRELTLEEIKKISLDILVDVANYCSKNNITYYLACGTLLGCIRHKGFIPWDDDIDIMMPRPDYEKFISEYKGKYIVLSPNQGMYYYGKVYDQNTITFEKGMDYKKHNPIGISIDVFPLDGMSGRTEDLDNSLKKSKFLETLLRLSNQPIFYRKNPIKCVNRIIPRLIGRKNIVKLIERNSKKYPYESSNYVIRYKHTPNGNNFILPKKEYEISKGTFEGHIFNIPSGYDKWLTSFFGDYKKLPPEDKRIIHIRNSYILKDKAI